MRSAPSITSSSLLPPTANSARLPRARGHFAPDFELRTTSGDHFKLSENIGKQMIVLNFFATWCGPCRAEMPELNRYFNQHKSEPFLLLAIDAEEKQDQVDDFFHELKLDFPAGIDQGPIQRQYGVSSFPTTVVIGVDGKIQFYESGALANADVAFDRFLKVNRDMLQLGQGITAEAYLRQIRNQPVLTSPKAEEKPADETYKLDDRGKRIVAHMDCPCGCDKKVQGCTCNTSSNIKKALANEDFKNQPDAEIMKALNKRFCAGGHVIVAENVHMRFRTRGQNGAGKSTAMYCFLGLLKPTTGKVEVMGVAPELGSALYNKVAYLPEEPHYHLYLTVEEATRYYASLYGKRVSDKTIHDALDRLGMAQFKHLPLSKCSKGMKQKVGIAQCLIRESSLLFLDEPTRGLDPLVVREFRETLREIHQRGATIVMNSHVLSEIEMLANRVAIIERGNVVAQDELRNLLTLDRELYSVSFEANGNVPDYLTSVERIGTVIKGLIPKARLYDFMDLTRTAGIQLQECSLKKTSLEDSFFQIVKGTGASEPVAPEGSQ